jgi:hypothetical protein
LLGGEGKEDALNAQKLGASDENKRDIRWIIPAFVIRMQLWCV